MNSGDRFPNSKQAKRAVAVKAVELLHKEGALNDLLLPLTEPPEDFVCLLNVCELEPTPPGSSKPGTRKRRQVYRKKIASALVDCRLRAGTGNNYLYRIALAPEWQETVGLLQSDRRSMGILSAGPLMELKNIDLYSQKFGPLKANLELITNLFKVSPQELALLGAFHEFLFADVLKIAKYPMEFGAPGESSPKILIVPLINHLPGLSEPEAYALDSDIESYMRVDETARRTAEELADAVVYPSHRPFDYFMHVTNNQTGILANSPFGFKKQSEYTNFVEFFKGEYKVELKDRSQPMVQMDYMTKNVSLISKSQLGVRNKQKKRIVLVPPELLHVHPVPASVWMQSSCVPSFLYRLNAYVLLEDFRNDVAEEIGEIFKDIAVPKTDHQDYRSLKHGQNDLFEKLTSPMNFQLLCCYANNPPVPSLDILLQAITAASANDNFSFETLEALGDSFLKLTTSIFLFSHFKNLDEGKLTLMRSRVVSNFNLYALPKSKELAGLLLYPPFDPRVTWFPPSFDVDDMVVRHLIDNGIPFSVWQHLKGIDVLNMSQSEILDALWIKGKFTQEQISQIYSDVVGSEPYNHASHQLVSDKSCADMMEGLIGAYLVNCGPVPALMFEYWLGLPLLKLENNAGGEPMEEGEIREREQLWKLPTTAFIKDAPLVHVYRLCSDLNAFEAKLEYTFKEKSFLLQALSHPSFNKNTVTDCYQRLEFLGDAVLDYLITCYIYTTHPEFTPGQLTDLRSALVSNNTFAYIAVQNDFQKYLRLLSPVLFEAITWYVNIVATLEHPFDTRKLLMEDDVQEDEEVEVPKALGDMIEAIAGAIFLDSGSSLRTVWHVLYKFFKPVIDLYSNDVPINPKREVFEMFPDAKFSKSVVDDNGKHVVTVTIGRQSFKGRGRNSHLAKLSAAKFVLRKFKPTQYRPTGVSSNIVTLKG